MEFIHNLTNLPKLFRKLSKKPKHISRIQRNLKLEQKKSRIRSLARIVKFNAWDEKAYKESEREKRKRKEKFRERENKLNQPPLFRIITNSPVNELSAKQASARESR